jgi:hypothetical protein
VPRAGTYEASNAIASTDAQSSGALASRLFHAYRRATTELCGGSRSWMSRVDATEMRHQTARYCGRPAMKACSTRLRAPLLTS